MSIWYLYLIRCADNTIYTGISTDVGRRLEEHRSGSGARYLRGRGPLVLERKFRVGTRGRALRTELLVKRLSHRAKEELIRGKVSLRSISGSRG